MKKLIKKLICFGKEKKKDKKKEKKEPETQEEVSEESAKAESPANIIQQLMEAEPESRTILLHGELNEEKSSEIIAGIIGLTKIKAPKKDLKEGESELEEIKAMVKQNFESEELDDATINQIANMIKAKRDKNKPPPQSGGNSGSGAPAQASLQEQKLRRAVRKIIKRKLKK